MPSRPPVHRSQGWRPYDKAEHQKQLEKKRKNNPSRKWYWSKRWKELRAIQLAKHPLCQCDDCQEGLLRVEAATVVDHRKPHKGDEQLFFDENNLMSMAKRCHDKKTASRDGGFGNQIKP